MDPNHDPSDPFSHQYYSMATELSDDMPHCFAHPPHNRGFPSNSTFEVSLQRKDGTPDLMRYKAKYPLQYVGRMLASDVNDCCFGTTRRSLADLLIERVLENAVRWYKSAPSHIGSTRLNDTMSMHFYNQS
jgi:hypothetical protein